MFGLFNKKKKEYKIGHKLYCSKQYEEAFSHLQYAADKGHVEAQFLIGDCYDNGRGVFEDVDKAVEWYEIAGNRGHAEAQYRLGMMFAEIMDLFMVAEYNSDISDPTQKARVGDEFFDGIISSFSDWANDTEASDSFYKKYNDLSATTEKWLFMAVQQGHKEAIREYVTRFK